MGFVKVYALIGEEILFLSFWYWTGIDSKGSVNVAITGGCVKQKNASNSKPNETNRVIHARWNGQVSQYQDYSNSCSDNSIIVTLICYEDFET